MEISQFGQKRKFYAIKTCSTNERSNHSEKFYDALLFESISF